MPRTARRLPRAACPLPNPNRPNPLRLHRSERRHASCGNPTRTEDSRVFRRISLKALARSMVRRSARTGRHLLRASHRQYRCTVRGGNAARHMVGRCRAVADCRHRDRSPGRSRRPAGVRSRAQLPRLSRFGVFRDAIPFIAKAKPAPAEAKAPEAGPTEETAANDEFPLPHEPVEEAMVPVKEPAKEKPAGQLQPSSGEPPALDVQDRVVRIRAPEDENRQALSPREQTNFREIGRVLTRERSSANANGPRASSTARSAFAAKSRATTQGRRRTTYRKRMSQHRSCAARANRRRSWHPRQTSPALPNVR